MVKAKFKIAIIAVLLTFTMVGFFIGKIVYQKNEVSFYAKIIKNEGKYLLVKGIEENDINHRGVFEVSSKYKSNITNAFDLYESRINFSDLSVGSLVQVSYDGVTLESHPGQFLKVYSVKIIE